jgi:hypothetical protein
MQVVSTVGLEEDPDTEIEAARALERSIESRECLSTAITSLFLLRQHLPPSVHGPQGGHVRMHLDRIDAHLQRLADLLR